MKRKLLLCGLCILFITLLCYVGVTHFSVDIQSISDIQERDDLDEYAMILTEDTFNRVLKVFPADNQSYVIIKEFTNTELASAHFNYLVDSTDSNPNFTYKDVNLGNYKRYSIKNSDLSYTDIICTNTTVLYAYSNSLNNSRSVKQFVKKVLN